MFAKIFLLRRVIRAQERQADALTAIARTLSLLAGVPLGVTEGAESDGDGLDWSTSTDERTWRLQQRDGARGRRPPDAD